MKTSKLYEALNNKEENFLLPFYWQHGDHTEKIPSQIRRIYNSGCRALCVEARPHPDFCEENWWRDLDIIVKECHDLGMKVWVLDDKHFPTGYANGAISKKHPECRAYEFTERHVDCMGPKKGTTLLVNEEELLGVFAYKRSGVEEEITGSPIDLSRNVKNGFLYFDVPEGLFRVFFVHKTRNGSKADYVDMISESSSRIMIEEVYEKHYEHYKEYFGNTFAGFFSDEPEIGNTYFNTHKVDYGFYDLRVGTDGVAFPVNDELINLMEKELGRNPLSEIPELWYFGDTAPEVRLSYMNAVTTLYRKNFCKAIGDWCRSKGVMYIGHIIEDRNNHTKLSHSVGHYFRGLEGQDMSGIDIVLHQVMPECAHFDTPASCSGGVSDARFFHYSLGQLACSLSDFYPHMKGRAMCEVFGAYGWGEGTIMMKWLMDFLLVRGVNHFVPHAFSPCFPDPDCPPHFGAEDKDPNYTGFTKLMHYTNKAAHLLYPGKHIIDVGILYHAEGEWMNKRDEYMFLEEPGKVLLDNHISYDIICEDLLYGDYEVKDNLLNINGVTVKALIVPYAKRYPKKLTSILCLLSEKFKVIYVTKETLDKLPEEITERDISINGDFPLLRSYHKVWENVHTYMFFNEGSTICDTTVNLGKKGAFAVVSQLFDEVYKGYSENGEVSMSLLPGESVIFIFGDDFANSLPEKTIYSENREISPSIKIELANSEDLSKFIPYKETRELTDINSPENMPGFAGKIKYTFNVEINDNVGYALDLGDVFENAELYVNGKYAGIKISKPYIYNLDNLLSMGENKVEVIVSNTLAGKVRDGFSYFLPLNPSGLLGPIKLIKKSN